MYKNYGLVTGIVDKYVDFVVGPGFFVKTENKNAKRILDDFMKDNNFDTVLRTWIKEALIKGNGYLELEFEGDKVKRMKVLDAKTMYVQRDKFGEVLAYNQYFGKLDSFMKGKIISFKPRQIAHITFNKLAGEAYGQGIVNPARSILSNIIGNEIELHQLLKRKANAPYHVKIGSEEEPASLTEIRSFASDLEHLNNKHEWVTDHTTEIKSVDFGNLGEKFEFVLKHDLDMAFFAFQVPEVLMGRGSIPEGLAQVQMDGFQRRVQSMQAEVEKLIESQIFITVLNSQNQQEDVEFEWGEPSDTEKNERILRINELLKLPILNSSLRIQLEEELAKLMGLKPELLAAAEEERKNEEQNQEAAPVPGRNRPSNQSYTITEGKHKKKKKIMSLVFDKLKFTKKQEALGWAKSNGFRTENFSETEDSWRFIQMSPDKFKDGMFSTQKIEEGVSSIQGVLKTEQGYQQHICMSMDTKDKDYDLKEWLDFDFTEYKQLIIEATDESSFELLAGTTLEDFKRGKFNAKQIEGVKSALKEGFVEGKTLNEIAQRIDEKANPTDLYNEEGKLLIGANNRSIMIARSETTRLAAIGSEKHFASKGIQRYQWVASLGERTCPICEGLHGLTFSVGQGSKPPAHGMCRCTIFPVEDRK